MRNFPGADSAVIALGVMMLAACTAQPTGLAEVGPDDLEPEGSVLVLEVHPSRAVIQPHDTIAFDAEIVLSDDVDMPALKWTASAGTITPNGILVAGTATGMIDVMVEVSGRDRTAHAEVLVVEEEPEPASVRIVPERTAVHPGDTARFEAVVHDDQGFLMDVSVTWSATGGSIDASGLYTARGQTGTFQVVAGGPSDLADTAQVEITNAPPEPADLTVSPTYAEFESGSALQFEAVVWDQYGHPLAAELQWSASGGVIGPEGRYTAGATSGLYEVRASGPDGLSATAVVRIREEERVASSVEVTPEDPQLTGGDELQFAATVLDQHGEPLFVQPVWAATGGNITSDGVFTAGSTGGVYPVVATVLPDAADTAWVTIEEAPDPQDPRPNGPTGNYTLVLEDRFDTLDPDRWSYNYPWSPVIINNEKQFYSPSQVVADGTLRITAIEEHVVDENGYEYDFQSGAITGYQKFEFLYGVIEFSAKVPEGRGLWPALWVNPPPGSWPPEIDVMENLGQDPYTIHHNVHWKDSNGNHQSEGTAVTGSVDYSLDFHTYTAEWTPDAVTFWIDGVQTGQVVGHSPSIPLYLIINLAVGGNWPGDPDDNTEFPAVFEVDYVRVWQE